MARTPSHRHRHDLRISRRRLLQGATFGLAGSSASGWLQSLAAETNVETGSNRKSVILLWLNGGPSTIDLWDLKPEHANGGNFSPIQTAVPDLQISQHLPNLARQADDLVLLRSLSSREGDHGRAAYFVRTGYKPQGGIDFADLGAVIAHEKSLQEADLPCFISIAPPRRTQFAGSGFLGPDYSPLMIGETAVTADDLKVDELHPAAKVSPQTVAARHRVLNQLDTAFRSRHETGLVNRYQTATRRAQRMMRPQFAAAFDLDGEPDKIRDSYGRGLFGQGCLLARRLVERGVPFVEVTLDGWDTHQNNFERVQGLSTQLDTGFTGLIRDLKQRGLLDSTLILCMGEFGRTPHINANIGRDHWPKVWAAALAGGGIDGGRAIGQTTKDGSRAADKPHTVPDLIATVCRAIDIDPRKQNASNVGRPIRVADPSARVIPGVL